MKQVVIQIKKKKIIINGKEYPPTRHNLNVWIEYKRTSDISVLEKLSTISLDI